MKKLFWSHDPVMSSVHASEDWVLHLRSTVGDALERAIAPVSEYLTTLEPFIEFLNVDGNRGKGLCDNSAVLYTYSDSGILRKSASPIVNAQYGQK